MNPVYLRLHFSILLFGFTAILGQLISVNEVWLVWYRMALTTLGFWVWFRWRGISLQVSRRQLLQLAGVGIILVLHWLCFFGSIRYSNVQVALVCFTSGTLFTAILDPLLAGRRIHPLELLYSGIVMLGIWLIYSFGTGYTMGILLGLGAAVTNAFYSIFNKKLVATVPEGVVNFYQIGTGWLILSLGLGGWLLTGAPAGWLAATATPQGYDVLWLLILAWLCTCYAYNLCLSTLRHVSVFELVLALNMEPVYAIVLAWLLLGEHLPDSPWAVAGMVLVLLGGISYPVVQHLRGTTLLRRVRARRTA